jgi:hypothetical protein
MLEKTHDENLHSLFLSLDLFGYIIGAKKPMEEETVEV